MSDNFLLNFQYPELYRMIDEECITCMDKHMCDKPDLYMPDECEMEEMVNEICDNICKRCPEIAQDPMENNRRRKNINNTRRYYGRRSILRDFVVVVLAARLIDRNRSRLRNRSRRRRTASTPSPFSNFFNGFNGFKG